MNLNELHSFRDATGYIDIKICTSLHGTTDILNKIMNVLHQIKAHNLGKIQSSFEVKYKDIVLIYSEGSYVY